MKVMMMIAMATLWIIMPTLSLAVQSTYSTGETCKPDVSKDCERWGRSGYCKVTHQHASYMARVCPTTCKCCMDQDSRCKHWLSYCPTNLYAKDKCRRKCSTCSQPVARKRFVSSNDAVYVHSTLGSTNESCGSITHKCKYLQQAVNKCKSGGKVIVLSDQTVTTEIQIRKFISLDGAGEVTITGSTSSGALFKVSQHATLRLFNLSFNDTGVASIGTFSVVVVVACSVRYTPKPLNEEMIQKRNVYRKTNEGAILPTAFRMTQSVFKFQSAADSVLKIVNSTFTGWNHGYVLKSSVFRCAYDPSNFQVLCNLPSSRLQISIENCIFVDTLGIYLNPVSEMKLKINNCTFLDTTCTAIHVQGERKTSGNHLSITKSSYINNKGCSVVQKVTTTRYRRFADQGGAINAENVVSVHVEGSVFKKCTTALPKKGKYVALGNGGAISVSNVSARFLVKNCVFKGNRAHSNGGDVFLTEGSKSVFEDSIFSESRATHEGGSIWVFGMTLALSNCSFTKCSTKSSGGAIGLSLRNSSLSYIKECRFTENIAQVDGGAISVLTKGSLHIQSSIFGDNQGHQGGAMIMRLAGNEKTASLLRNCQFTRNRGITGGALYIVKKTETSRKLNSNDSYSIALCGCEFLNNSASSSGQTVFNSSAHIRMEDVTIMTFEEYTVPHLLSKVGHVHLSNVTLKLFRHIKSTLYPKSKGIVLQSEEIRMSNGFTFTCPTNFNIDELKNATLIMHSLDNQRVEVKHTLNIFFSAGCTACEIETYTLRSGRLFLPLLSENYPAENLTVVENAKCMPCPTGAVCGTAGVKAVENFWGHVSPDSRLTFKLCPRGYCCGTESVPCMSYDTCAVGRKGTLCGTCGEGFKQNFIDSDCIRTGDPCDMNEFVTYFVVYTVAYTVIFIFVTNIKTIISAIKSMISKKRSITLVEEVNSEDGNRDTFSIAGFVQIVILFFQVSGLLHVKFHDRQQQKESSSKKGFQDSVADIFNFRFVIYQHICPSDEVTLPQKAMILFSMKLATFSVLLLLVIIQKGIMKIVHTCKLSFFQHNGTSSTEDQSTELTSFKIETAKQQASKTPEELHVTLSFVCMVKCTFIKLLKMYFTPVTNFVLTMTHCVSIADQSRLYSYGDHVCYSAWQLGIIGIILPCLVMFPICFGLAVNLLKDRLISSWQFVFAAFCPYYGFVIYALKRKCQQEGTISPASLSVEEDTFRTTILEGEEELLKDLGNYTLGWTIVQLYRSLALSAINTFIINPLYKELAYGVLVTFFVAHDFKRKPYKNEYLNNLQCLSSGCLSLVVLCNVIPAVSYLVNLRNVPFIHEVVEMFGAVELMVYGVVPLSLPVWKLKTYIQTMRSGESGTE